VGGDSSPPYSLVLASLIKYGGFLAYPLVDIRTGTLSLSQVKLTDMSGHGSVEGNPVLTSCSVELAH